MKKMFVVMLAVLTASVASASVTIGVGGVDNPQGDITLNPSNTVALQVFGDDPTPPVTNDYYILMEGPGAINGATMIWGHLDSSTYYQDLEDIAIEQGTTPENILIGWGGQLGMALTDVSHFVLGDTSEITPPYAGILVNDIIFHCEGEGDVTITLMNGSNFEVLDTQVIHQEVPEPITVALLGLGGLMLRRRKK